jgi:hypothetical protein
MALGRDTTGKFTPGNGGGGARPGSGQKPLIERELLDKAISPAQWVLIAATLRDNAIGGCTRSAALLLDRRFGRVKEVLEEAVVDIPAITVTFHAPQIEAHSSLPLAPPTIEAAPA